MRSRAVSASSSACFDCGEPRFMSSRIVQLLSRKELDTDVTPGRQIATDSFNWRRADYTGRPSSLAASSCEPSRVTNRSIRSSA